jgi:hypothetical protein
MKAEKRDRIGASLVISQMGVFAYPPEMVHSAALRHLLRPPWRGHKIILGERDAKLQVGF